MGLRNWFRRFVSKVKEVFGVYDKYTEFTATAYFSDGGSMTFTGRPWGGDFDLFKYNAEEYAYAISMNMTGSFWSRNMFRDTQRPARHRAAVRTSVREACTGVLDLERNRRSLYVSNWANVVVVVPVHHCAAAIEWGDLPLLLRHDEIWFEECSDQTVELMGFGRKKIGKEKVLKKESVQVYVRGNEEGEYMQLGSTRKKSLGRSGTAV
ncbi:hypothetical protein HJFPF1_02597 [Paramyrothecium foliicola]|nr:hypothetical protein HJFPF1_02597 [Paramyrothecium foliicola]